MNVTHDDLADVLGFAATVRLAAWYGDGDGLNVPAAVDPACRLARLIGLAAARRMAATWGGQVLAIQRLRDYEDEVQRCRIARLLEKGFSLRQVAGMERMGEHRVRRIWDELARAGLIRSFGAVKRVRTGIVRRGTASAPLAQQLQGVSAGAPAPPTSTSPWWPSADTSPPEQR